MILLHTLRPGARFKTTFGATTLHTGTLLSKTPSCAVVRYDEEHYKPANPSAPTLSIALNTEVEEIK